MKLTQALKDYAVKNFGLSPSDSDAKFRAIVALKLNTGELKPATLRQLTTMAASPQRRQTAAPVRRSAPTTRQPVRRQQQPAMTPAEIEALVTRASEAAVQRAVNGLQPQQRGLTPEAVVTKAAPIQARVKMAMEQYSNHRKDAYYPQRAGFRGDGRPHLLAGQRAHHGNTPLYHGGELDMAVCSAYMKWTMKSVVPANELPPKYRLTDHDMDLLNWSMRNQEWTGMVKSGDAEDGGHAINRRKMSDFEIKALLDDSTSGGIEATPYVFDDAIVLIPVLYGELFPLVNVVNVARGRRMKGAAMTNPTFTSGTAEGTAIGVYDTTDFVSAFDTTIFPAVAAMEIGLDFEEDSPVDLGKQIVENYGLKALEWLDRVVAVGDGTTEPQGIFNATGTTTVSADNSTTGPLTVSDFEGLMFGMEKKYRTEPGSTPVFVSNDTMYRRARGINVGSGDQRRVFGLDHGSYTLLDRPYKVQNNIGNGKLAYVNLKRYRMYRRLGLAVRYENTGYTLARSNTRLIVLRMRYGGKLETGGACAKIIDAQA